MGASSRTDSPLHSQSPCGECVHSLVGTFTQLPYYLGLASTCKTCKTCKSRHLGPRPILPWRAGRCTSTRSAGLSGASDCRAFRLPGPARKHAGACLGRSTRHLHERCDGYRLRQVTMLRPSAGIRALPRSTPLVSYSEL